MRDHPLIAVVGVVSAVSNRMIQSFLDRPVHREAMHCRRATLSDAMEAARAGRWGVGGGYITPTKDC